MTVHVSRQGAEVARRAYRLLQDERVTSSSRARQVLHGLSVWVMPPRVCCHGKDHQVGVRKEANFGRGDHWVLTFLTSVKEETA